MKINAVIQNRNGGTLVWEFPGNIYKLRTELEKIGINRWPGRISLVDNEDDPISVKLYAEDDVGNHLIRLFSEKDSLEDIDGLTGAIVNANGRIREKLRQKILNDRYPAKEDLYQDIRKMTYDAESLTETFYFPLTGNVYDNEYAETFPVSKYFLLQYEDDIRDALCQYLDRDTQNMAGYYDDAGKEKILLADWDVIRIGKELFGKVDIRLTEPLSAVETECLKSWIIGQNSDGLGEGFEQQEIRVEDGRLYVSFWRSGDSYFLYNQEEMDAYTGQEQGPQMGGM